MEDEKQIGERLPYDQSHYDRAERMLNNFAEVPFRPYDDSGETIKDSDVEAALFELADATRLVMEEYDARGRVVEEVEEELKTARAKIEELEKPKTTEFLKRISRIT